MTAGAFDLAVFAAYRAAPPGPRKTMLANRLHAENIGLVKQLLDQMVNGASFKGGRVPKELRRLHRAELIESWEEAEGAAGLAFTKMLRDYDPAKGAVSFFLGMKIKYELQCLIERSTNIRLPRDMEDGMMPQGWLRDMGQQEEGFGELVHRRRVDDGENCEAVDEGELPAETGPAVLPTSALDHFLSTACVFHRRLRIARATLHAAYQRHARRLGCPVAEARLRAALRVRNVKAAHLRLVRGEPSLRAYEGISLRADLEKQAT